MFFIELCFTLELPLANPTPMTAPTSVWVGEIGIPNDIKRKTTEAVDIWAENPRVGTSSVILFPIVSVTRFPARIIPHTSPRAPKIFKVSLLVPMVANNTPVATAISSAPTLRAENEELPICRYENTFSSLSLNPIFRIRSIKNFLRIKYIKNPENSPISGDAIQLKTIKPKTTRFMLCSPILTIPRPNTALTIASEPDMGIFLNKVMVIHKPAARVTTNAPTLVNEPGGIIPSLMVFITFPPRNKAPINTNMAPIIKALLILSDPLPTEVPMEFPISLAAILNAI